MPLSSWRKRESETQRGKWGRSNVPPMLTMFSCQQWRIPPGRPCKQCTPSLNHIHTRTDFLGSVSLSLTPLPHPATLPSVWLRQHGQLAYFADTQVLFFFFDTCLLISFLFFGIWCFFTVLLCSSISIEAPLSPPLSDLKKIIFLLPTIDSKKQNSRSIMLVCVP